MKLVEAFAAAILLSSFAFADEPIFGKADRTLPTTNSVLEETTVQTKVTRSAVAALVAGGAEKEEVSEDEAVARAEANGVKLERNEKGSPNFGHPWTIIKAGFGSSSAINLLAEIYVNDNWTIEPRASVGLSYGALTIGTRWHPDKLCWGCKGYVGFTISPGIETGFMFSGMNYGQGAIVATSLDGELILRPKQHLLFTLGVRGSGGALIEAPYVSHIWNPGPPTNPGAGHFVDESHGAKPHAFFDGLLYVGVGW